jgi:hypothetical protein
VLKFWGWVWPINWTKNKRSKIGKVIYIYIYVCVCVCVCFSTKCKTYPNESNDTIYHVRTVSSNKCMTPVDSLVWRLERSAECEGPNTIHCYVMSRFPILLTLDTNHLFICDPSLLPFETDELWGCCFKCERNKRQL